MTDPLGQSQVIPYLIGLSKKGIKFHIISCEKKHNYNKNKNCISKLFDENNIDWHPLLYTKQPPIFSTLWDVWHLKRKSINLHKKENFKIIHCRSYIPSLTGLNLKKKYNIKFIFDMRGFWADERVDGNLWNTHRFIYKKIYQYFKNKEWEFLNLCDAVISLTENGKKEILSWSIPKLNSDKISVIPCAADENTFTLKTKESQIAAKQKINVNPDTFILSYIGSLGTWYLLDEMLLFFSVLKSAKPNSKFLFLTPDKKENIFQTGKKYSLLPEDFIICFSHRNEIPSYIHASDLSIFFIKPSYSKKSSSPTKMGELLVMGIPIICNGNVGDVEDVIKKTKSGICVNSFTKSDFEKIVSGIDELLYLSSEKIRKNSLNYFQLSNGINSYFSVYNKLS